MGKSPSRIRYEKENPVVSIRISQEKKDQLDDLTETLDVTKKEWFESVIGDQAQDVEAAWEGGYQDAKEEYLVEVPCVICKEPAEIWRDETKEEIASILLNVANDNTENLFWWRGHKDCL